MTEKTVTASTEPPSNAIASAPATSVTEPGSSPPRPRRQEQEPASEEITEVAPGILRLQLPIDLPGLGHVNTYALEDGEGFALVDPGLPGKKSWDVLNRRLDAAGIPLARIHTVFVTHSHPDHFGGAGLIAEQTGARIVASDRFQTMWDPSSGDDRELEGRDPAKATRTFARLLTGETHDEDGSELPESPFHRPTPWGGRSEGPPPGRREEIAANMAEFIEWFRVPHPTLRLADDDPIRLAGRDWFALFTPGHTDDHLCLWDPTEGVMLSGDHVLPTITPHISGMTEGDPLTQYLDSLDRVAAFAGVNQVLPAHGHPFTDLAGRVDEIKQHHAERCDQLREISSDLGWASVEGLSHEIFKPRSWGTMAESETYAHLEHLRLRGEAERREETGGILHYLVH